VEHEDDGP